METPHQPPVTDEHYRRAVLTVAAVVAQHTLIAHRTLNIIDSALNRIEAIEKALAKHGESANAD